MALRRSIRLQKRGGVFRASGLDSLRSQWRDPYRLMLAIPWPGFLALIALAYLATNVVFAALYQLDPAGIGGMPPGKVAGFAEAFFFSVQTLGSIGYGVLHPASRTVHLLVTLEAFVSLIFMAVTTGLVFARFSRSRAVIRFSSMATVEPWNGVPCLTFRLVNLHHNSLVDGHLDVFLAIDDQSLEGNWMRRMVPLPLLRERSFHFRLFWTAMHPIDASSPLRGHDNASLAARNAEVLVSFRGVDETVRSPVYARQSYPGADLRFDAAFDDIVIDRDEEDRDLDFSRLDRIHPHGAGPAGAGDSGTIHG